MHVSDKSFLKTSSGEEMTPIADRVIQCDDIVIGIGFHDAGKHGFVRSHETHS